MVFTGGRIVKNSAWMDVRLFTIFDVFGRGLKNCIDADLFGGTGYVGGDWKKVWMWIDLGCSGV